ncbi:MAG: response regulator [candidate division Zixibacteria bacterium]|nr:response regulator [candidate division Zixibacteria bacterium]
MPDDLPPQKSRWHPLSLQRLDPNRFADVVNRILDGQLSVLRSHSPHKSKRVLVTDDNETHAQILMDVLESDIGVSADWVNSAEKCVQTLRRTRFDLLILDYRLPRKDGLWVINQLVREELRIPVLMMTSFYHPQLAASIRQRFAVEILDKANGGLEPLTRMVERMLHGTAAPAAND